MPPVQAYSNNLVDHHLILDLMPALMRAYFGGRIPATLSYGQAAIFLCLGLQQIDVSGVERALNLPSSQVLALFNKVDLPLCLRNCREKLPSVALQP